MRATRQKKIAWWIGFLTQGVLHKGKKSALADKKAQE